MKPQTCLLLSLSGGTHKLLLRSGFISRSGKARRPGHLAELFVARDLVFRVATARDSSKRKDSRSIDPHPRRRHSDGRACIWRSRFCQWHQFSSAVRARAKGLDLVIVGCITTKAMHGLVGNKETRTVKGKVIGVTGPGVSLPRRLLV